VLEVVGIAVFGAAFCEAICYALIFRTDTYKRLTASIEKVSKRIEKKKEASEDVPSKQKARQQKIDRIEKTLGPAEKSLAVIKMRVQLVNMATHIITLITVTNKYHGIPVARLPFSPPGFMHSVTHRNLPGEDYAECSVVFFYMLCSLAFKPNLQRALGFAPWASKGSDPFAMTQQMLDKSMPQ